MKELTLEKILLALLVLETETKDSSVESSTRREELKPEQMVSMLRQVFGDRVDIIDPALSLQASPLAAGPTQGAGSVLYLQALRKLAAPGARDPVLSPLIKPIVMLIAQPWQTTHVWKTVVIVPKNYQPPEGKSVGNDQNPLFYYFDPQSALPASQAPREVVTFCQALMQGCQVLGEQRGRKVRVTAQPVLGPLGFFHGCRRVSTSPSDSAWWALYFAIMAVGRGGVSFPEMDRLSLSRLQTVLGSLDSSFAQESASSSSSGSSTSISEITESAPAMSSSAEPTSSTVATLPETLLVSELEEKKPLIIAPTYDGPVYTPAIMAGILRAYHIAPSPDDKLSRDSSGGFELTAYPGSNLNETVFLQDSLHYWQAQQGRLENRRVAYLFNAANSQTGQSQSLGVVIQYSTPNTALASQLWQEQKEEKLELKSSQIAPQFYGQVQVTVLGVPVQQAVVAQLKVPLTKIGRGQITLNFKAIPPNSAYSVLLIEDMLGMLQHGQTREVDPETVAAAHRERCVQALLTRWAETEHRDTALQQELTAVLRTVLIMATLQTQRRSEYRLSGEGMISPKIIKTRDEAMKRHLYAQRFPDQRALIEGLPLAVLASFLVTTDAVENIKTLNQHRDQLRREIRFWEMDLEEKIRHHRTTPCDVLTQAWQFIYHSSFLGLGGELFRLASAPLETARESAGDLAAQEALLVSRMVKRVTRSETLSARSETAVRLFLGTEPISRSLGVLGTLVGATVQIALGPYAFVQMLGISALTLRMHHTVEARRLDEPRAELRSSVLSLNVLHRLCVLLWHGGEALALGSVVPLVSATGGLVGSAVAVAITSPLSPPASRPELGGLLVRQTGAIVGQRSMMALLVMAIGVQHRILYRDTAVALLSHSASRQPGIREWKIEGADFRNPRLWSNSQHNPLTLSWLTQSGATRRVECEIQGLPVLTPAEITGLVCAGDVPDPELSTTLGLPRP